MLPSTQRVDDNWRSITGTLRKPVAERVVSSRLPALLAEHTPALVIVSVGGNDFLRKLPEADTRANVHAICAQARDAGAGVLVIGRPITEAPDPGEAARRIAESLGITAG